MRTAEQLITVSRRATGNQDWTPTAGVQDEEFLQALNDAQEEIHSIINSLFPTILMTEKYQDVTIGNETYAIPSDCYMGTRIDNISYSPSGLDQDFYPIRKGSLKERIDGINGNPSFYLRQGSNLIIQPPPQQGGRLRIVYQKTIPYLDITRGTVDSVTLTTNTITSLVLSTSVSLDADALNEQPYITVCDKYGNIKMQNIKIDSVSGVTGVVTITPGFTFESGETIEVGDYVLRGKYSTILSQLPDICEKYLLEYCNMRIFVRDSSTDQQEVAALMSKIENTLRMAFSEPDNDPDRIPIIDPFYLGYEL